MQKLLFILSLLFSLNTLNTQSQSKENCSNWIRYSNYGKTSYIYLKHCASEYSGSMQLKNTNSKSVRISLILTYNTGKTSRESYKIKAHSTTNPISCYSCNPNLGGKGLDSWEITKIKFEGEQGYW